MKKILLMSFLTCNIAFAGGQEGTGSKPDEGMIGASSIMNGTESGYLLVCVKNNNNKKKPSQPHCQIVNKSKDQ